MSEQIEAQDKEKEKQDLFNLIKAVIKALRFADDGSFDIYLDPPLYLSDSEFKSFFNEYDEFGGFVELGGYYFAELYYITNITKNDKDPNKCTENRKHITILFGIKDNGTYEIVHIKGRTESKITDCP
jgi:hypothetical protein